MGNPGPPSAGTLLDVTDATTPAVPSSASSGRTKTVLSGIQPTGAPHLGNYLGALRWWVDFQDRYDAFYCVVDLHALTVPGNPSELSQATLTMATLCWRPACARSAARCLSRAMCTSIRAGLAPRVHRQHGRAVADDPVQGQGGPGGRRVGPAGLFAYPVLMAADILLYQADLVPVGDDQRQHLELTRDLAQRWNTRYGTTFTVPDAAIPPVGGGARIMDLQDPVHKMSKSAASDAGLILLFDDPKVIERKVKRAVTDLDPPGPGAVRWDLEAKPGVSNLLELLATLLGGRPEEIAAGYDSYGKLKADAAEAVLSLVVPLQERYRALEKDPAAVKAVLAQGAARARRWRPAPWTLPAPPSACWPGRAGAAPRASVPWRRRARGSACPGFGVPGAGRRGSSRRSTGGARWATAGQGGQRGALGRLGTLPVDRRTGTYPKCTARRWSGPPASLFSSQ